MSYASGNPTWNTGDVITATKLNNIEAAIIPPANIDIMLRNIIKLLLKQTGVQAGVNAWSDTLDDTTGINAGASNYTFDSVRKSIKPLYTTDKCTGGTPIAVDSLSGYPVSNAFDDNISTFWMSAGYGSAINGKWFGYVFASAISPARIRLYQPSSPNAVSSVTVQYSTDGSTYYDLATFSVGVGDNYLDLPIHPYNARYWRLRANSGVSSTVDGWAVYECEFYEFTIGTVIWNAQSATASITKAVVEAVENFGTGGTIAYYISRDGGISFTQVPKGVITDISSQPSGTSIVCKAVLTGQAELLAIGYGGEI